jgi:hypothetical protein
MRIRVTMIIEAPDDYNYGEVEDTILNAIDEDGTCEIIEFVDMEDF